MTVIIFVLTIVTIITGLNSLAVLGITRRLRDQRSNGPSTVFTLPVGSQVPDYRTLSLAGAEVNKPATGEADQVIAFFSADCDTCIVHAPQFAKAAAKHKRSRAIAVISGEGPHIDMLVEQLSEHTAVVTEPIGGPLGAALAVEAYPCYVRVGDHGVVASTALRVSDIDW